MRSVVLIIIVVVICGFSCKKGNSVSPTLFGKWELRHSYGGLAGSDSVYKAGNGNILQFNNDSTYKRFEANKLTSQGVFHIKHYTNPDGYGIYFDNTTYGDAFSRNGTTMTIGTTVTDGVASDYQKIAN